LLAAPADLPKREAELATLDWRTLTREELGHMPAVIVIASERLLAVDPGGLFELLRSDLPIKVVLLAEGGTLGGGIEPLLPLLGLRRPFVLSTTVAHTRHLFEGVQAAMRHEGPALISVYAPSPARHGFSADATVERARLAADCRIQPLLSYDPDAAGVFGSRLDLQGNVALDRAWPTANDGTELGPAYFAAGERRFGDRSDWDDANRSVAETWRTLQEWAGVVTPFTEQVRALAVRELEVAHRHELDVLRAEYERRLAEAEQQGLARHTNQLRARLIELVQQNDHAKREKPS
jgi:pyruvate-ferredoxin/flavodoxin oxidoreductase